MGIPPCYADLGKSAKDLFDKGYSKFCSSLKIFLISILTIC